MTEDEESQEARDRRAERLREEIERLKKGDEEPAPPPRSPLEFIEERMRELDRDEEPEPEDEESEDTEV